MELMNPCGVFEVRTTALTPRAALHADATVGLLANDKKNADVLLENVQRYLSERLGLEKFLWLRKEATKPASLTEEFTSGCDAVVAAVCD